MKNRDLETAIDFSQLLTMSADEASDFIFNHFRGGMDSLEAEELYLQRSFKSEGQPTIQTTPCCNNS
ncbi:MAG: hypothetical protein IPF46_10515 [Saprospiraceae bacterium]|nr:hypothetical protein [Candidatus Vicinibacter affinis]